MKPHSVLISASAPALREHQEAVTAALEGLGLEVVTRQPDSEAGAESRVASTDAVAECDIFVGLYAGPDGASRDDSDATIIEIELENARLQNKPLFCFFLQEDDPPIGPQDDPEFASEKLKHFTQRVMEDSVHDDFTTPDDCAAKVTTAIRAYIDEHVYPPDGDRVTVERVIDATAPWVLPALSLFTRRIPEGERPRPDEIVRWLQKTQERDQTGDAPVLYFLVARTRVRICGFTLIHYSRQHKIAFIAYLVAEIEVPLARGTIGGRLFDEVARLLNEDEQLRACRGFLLEAEDPRFAATAKEQRHRTARLELFCALARSRGYVMCALGVDYVQPLLASPAAGDEGHELPMLLMYASKSQELRMPRTEARRILELLYLVLYPEGFCSLAKEDDSYRAYLIRLCAQQVARLPEYAPLFRSSDIRNGTAFWSGV